MRRKGQKGATGWWVFLIAAMGWMGVATAEAVRDLAGLVKQVEAGGAWTGEWVLEGRICAVAGESSQVVFMDRSGTMWLECEDWGVKPEEGMEWRLSGERCVVRRQGDRLALGTGPVVEMDGHHSLMTGSGSVYLQEGWNPFCLEWFNGFAEAELMVDWREPGRDWQPVPASALAHRAGEETRRGLEYAVYEGERWHRLPDFSKLEPVKSGVVARPEVGVRTRPEHVAVVFQGGIEAKREGWHSFRVTADDGVRLRVGGAKVRVEVLGHGEVPAPLGEDAVAVGGVGHWMEREGRVGFAAWREGIMELEVRGPRAPQVVHWLSAKGVKPEELLHRRVVVRGVGRSGEDLVAGDGGVRVIGEAGEVSDEVTEIGEIRQLRRDEARRAIPARLRGVVTMAAAAFLVMQDATGGVFVSYAGVGVSSSPKPGEVWEICGRTDPGDFSPMILAESLRYVGVGALPEAVSPSWEQLVSGSLDAEMVEMEGVVDAVSGTEMILLMREGKMRILYSRFHPLPFDGRSEEELKELKGSVVRVRGVYTANWDGETGQVNAGICLLGNAVMSIEKPAPEDPFAAPRLRAAELFLFTSQSTRFRRVVVEGVVLGVRGKELLLADGEQGFRAIGESDEALKAGDRVEVAGYPRLGGVAAVSLEGRVRKLGRETLPEPLRLTAEQLPDKRWDATWVAIEAEVRSDMRRESERVLDLQTGDRRWVARLAAPEDEDKPIERGSLVRVTGVYSIVPAERTGGEIFEVLVKGSEDLNVLQRGPWWTKKHTLGVIVGLAGALVLAGGWVMLLKRTVALRGRQLAAEIEEREESERHRVMERERARVAQDLHDELGSGLTEAGMLTALAKNPAIPEERKERYLEQLAVVCRDLVTGLDEIVWAVNPRYDSVGDLAGYFSLYAQRFLGLAGIRCRLKIEESVGFHPLDARQRHGVFLAFKEALNNLVKHSGADEAFLRIGVEGGVLRVEVRDGGKGFVIQEEGGKGEGLGGMSRRMEELGGRCRVAGQEGEGTTVALELPLPESSS